MDIKVQKINEWLQTGQYGVPDFIEDLLGEVTDTEALIKWSYALDYDENEVFIAFAENRLEDIAHGTNDVGLLRKIADNSRNMAKKLNAERKMKDLV